MIIALLLQGLLFVLTAIFSIFPVVYEIPLFDDYLVYGFSFWTAFLNEIPLLLIPWGLFLWYVAFRFSLILLKFLFGHRINI